ncbi:MAG: hypothetical protein ACKV0T_01035 [Planctomycetales bacterium]
MVGTVIDCQLQIEEANSTRPEAVSLSAAPRESCLFQRIIEPQNDFAICHGVRLQLLTRSRGDAENSGPWSSHQTLAVGFLSCVSWFHPFLFWESKRNGSGKGFTARRGISKCDFGLDLAGRWGQDDVEELFVSRGMFLSFCPNQPASIVLPFHVCFPENGILSRLQNLLAKTRFCWIAVQGGKDRNPRSFCGTLF